MSVIPMSLFPLFLFFPFLFILPRDAFSLLLQLLLQASAQVSSTAGTRTNSNALLHHSIRWIAVFSSRVRVCVSLGNSCERPLPHNPQAERSEASRHI
eukprot:4291277-Amphidinium_carterae.1